MFKHHIFKSFLVAGTALSLIACSGGTDHSEMTHNKNAAMQMNGVEVSGAYIKPPFTGRTTSAAFMRLDNKGAATRLLAASSPISPRVEIHTHLEEDGVMKMRRVEGIDIGAGESVELKPGGYHLMMFDTVIPEGDSDAPLTLIYENGKKVTLIVPLGDGPSAMDEMDHSGH